jgi:Cu/Ag efflux pump CusA
MSRQHEHGNHGTVGLIALLGIDAETGVFVLLYLDLAYEEAEREGRLNSLNDLREAIVHGAAKRLRPKFMTFATTCVGLFPIMWATGAGSDVMRRIAAPMVGGIFTSFVLELLVYPAIYEVWRWGSYLKGVRTTTGLGSLELQPDAGSAGSPRAWKSSIRTQETPTSQ